MKRLTQVAKDDLEHVTYLAREMVTKFGFSPLGPISLENQVSEVFLGSGVLGTKKAYSQTTGKNIDRYVHQLVFDAMDKTMAVLRPRRQIMDYLVDALIEEETIYSDKFISLGILP